MFCLSQALPTETLAPDGGRQVVAIQRFYTTDFREPDPMLRQHSVPQIVITAGGFNERLVFLAVTIPHNRAKIRCW